MKKSISKVSEKVYRGYKLDGKNRDLVISRAYHKLPNGEPAKGMWCVYDEVTGELLDKSPFRNDLIEKWFD